MHAFILFIRYVFGFPQKLLTLFLHLSKWKYNSSILEYFVETSTKQVIKQSELLKRHENTHIGDAWLQEAPTRMCVSENTVSQTP